MPSTLAPLMRKTQKESRYWALPGRVPEPSPGHPHPFSAPVRPFGRPCQLWAPNVPAGGPDHRALVPWGGHARGDGCPCLVPTAQLLDSDQELYRNFPLTISERWQQEVAETVFDTINAETDRLETRKKTKNKQLGHEEGEGRWLPWVPTARFIDEKQAWGSGTQPRSLPESSRTRIPNRAGPLPLLRQTTPWARTASCTATCPRWATPS